MTKNIVLCSDGTGNKGGDGTGTNVYKLYHAVKLDDPNALQITYYDNGRHPEKNKYVSGSDQVRSIRAFGLGFNRQRHRPVRVPDGQELVGVGAG